MSERPEAAPTIADRWTPAQRAAIRHVDGALLVSAAAGSGKTAVLAERCAYLVCDAPEPCDVDQLLVLTFTRAAAAEMRERIDGVIRSRADRAGADPRIFLQLRLMDRAQITTLDGFCGSLVRTHFHLVGVDPTFAMLAPEDANLIKADVAQTLIDGEYDAERAATFKLLLDGYFASDEAALRRQVIAAHALLQSVVDPDAWIEDAVARLYGAAASTDAALFGDYAALQQRELHAAIRRLEQVARRATHGEGLAPYASHAEEISVDLREWLFLSEQRRFDVLASRMKAYKLPRLPAVKKDVAGKAELQGEIDDVKKRLKGKGKLRSLCIFSGEQLRADLARIAPLADYFFGLVARFTTGYDRAKRDLRSLDFADTETLALRILRAGGPALAPSAAAVALHARFRHVLVDEYQDINPLQNAILRLVSRDRAAELAPAETRSNFFTVGDVKQSIYGFRLAEPRQFIEREASLRAAGSPLGHVIDLQENFRSRAPLLNAINDVFRLLMTAESTGIDYDATQELRSLNDYPPVAGPHFAGKPIEFHLLPREPPIAGDDDADDDDSQSDSFDREIALVARRIRELVCAEAGARPTVMEKTSDGLKPRPIRYGDIAVLLRTRRVKSSQMADALRAQGIPVHSDDSTGFFDATEVQDVLAVLRVLSNGRQDIPLAAHMRSPLSPVTVTDKDDALARVRIAYPEEPYHRAVARYADEQPDALALELRTMLNDLAAWRRMFQERPVGESLVRIYEHRGFLTFCRALPDGAQRVANLGELLARGETFDAFERQGLDRFLAFIEELAADDQLGRPSLDAESTDVVRIMTVHRSKGLEFPVVIIPDLGKGFNERSLNDPVLIERDKGIGMTAVDLRRRIRYPSAASLVVRDHARRQALAEEIRVLYVALTRAREHLILIGSTRQKEAMTAWRDAWAGHGGPLPDESIQDAATALDWLGPVVAITAERALGTFAVTDRTAEPDDGAMPADTRDDADDPTRPCSPGQAELPAPLFDLTDADAQVAVARLTFAYPHAAATRQQATIRVSDFAKAAVQQDEPRTTSLPWPATYRGSDRPKAVDVGTATHRLLQFLDLNDAADAAAIDAQVASLVARRLMTPAESKLVDVRSIAWFAASELGELMRRPGVRLLREQTLALNVVAVTGGSADDLTLLRGRVDALLVAPEGLTLLDYKSDRVEAEEVGTRAARYMPQVAGYADALTDITGMQVVRAALVFLRPQRIIDVPLAVGRSR